MTLNPSCCPKWDSCNAPVCPLDKGFPYSEARTQKGEAVCLWLREAVKAGGMERIPEGIAPKIREALPILLKDGGAVLRSKLEQARRCGSKVARGRAEGRPAARATNPRQQRPETARHVATGHPAGAPA